MKLKKGMKVQLKFLSKIDDTRLSVMPPMEKYFGRVVALRTDPDADGDFKIVGDALFFFSSDWVAAVIDSQGFGVGTQKEKHKDIRLIRMRVCD